MADHKREKLDIDAGEVITYGDALTVGIVEEIRIIDSASFVKHFSGGADEVMIRIRTQNGTALIWPGRFAVSKLSTHEAKAFKAKLKRPEISSLQAGENGGENFQ